MGCIFPSVKKTTTSESSEDVSQVDGDALLPVLKTKKSELIYVSKEQSKHNEKISFSDFEIKKVSLTFFCCP